ncbi:MAG: hypothetical protein KDM63_20870, partial [Verrucomicrobiae bacterium]|nr:hypothetical protein [Verrucomicrobiae bacterium]
MTPPRFEDLPEEDRERFDAYLDGTISPEEFDRLQARLLENADLRATMRRYLALDEALRSGTGAILKTSSAAETTAGWTGDSPVSDSTKVIRFPRLRALAAAALVIGAFVWFLGFRDRPRVIASFDGLHSCRWMDPCARVKAGDPIALGERIGLSAGRAELRFNTGAQVTLHGPAIFEARSRNGGFLILGKADFIAETTESKGFVLETPTSNFGDIGTAFSAGVAPDGLSRLEVSKGIVDVVLADPDSTRRLKAGDTMWVEPGEKKILTRIEAGDGTPAFRFPTLPPPSADDYADRSQGHASIHVTRGTLGRDSGRIGGSADVLLDGVGQSKQDS